MPPTSSITRRIAALAALAVTSLASAAHAQSASVLFEGTANPNARLTCASPASQNPATLNGVQASCPANNDARVRDVLVHSPGLNDDAWARVILPPGFTKTKKWPVLFLLTGHGGTFQSWSCDSFVEKYLANAGVLVVMPDGTRRYNRCDKPDGIPDDEKAIPSLYSDWQSPSNDGSPEKWETFHLAELLPLLQTRFSASTKIAIAGLSMGGGGALTYAGRNPTKFVAAASYSGALNYISGYGQAAENAGMLAADQDTNAPWGYYPGTPGAAFFGTQWPAHNSTSLAANLLGIPVFVASGDGSVSYLNPSADGASQAIESGAKSMAQDFVNAITAANGGTAPSKLQVDFYKGTHGWPYWDAELCRSLPMLMAALGVPYSSPVTCNVPRY